MNTLPVIRRELRAQARQPLTYWSRTMAVGAMLGATLFFAVNNDFSPSAGAHLLTYLHGCLFVSIWLFVPVMTADCLSRERREGTLSLLFLTNLRPFDIVLAKTSAHALRAFTLWLATVPALTLPFLLGGAGWQHAVLSVQFNFMALCIALGAGVLASSGSKAWAQAVTSALVTGFVFLTAFSLANAFAMTVAIESTLPAGQRGLLQQFWRAETAVVSFAVPIIGPQLFSQLRLPAGAVNVVLQVETLLTFASLLFLWLCLRGAAWNVAKNWRDEPSSAWVQWLERQFCTPIVGVNFLRRWLRHTLERNPVGWLEQRTWTGRALMWGWLAVVTSVYVTIFSGLRFTPVTYEGLQAIIAWSLAVSMAFTAAGSFRRERETGVLELLLVSPTSTWQVLSGRVKGLWGQFLPALGLLFGVWLFLFTFADHRLLTGRIFFHAVLLVTVPVIGLYYSLAKRGFFSAMLWTLWISCLLPVLAALVIRLLLYFPGGRYAVFSVMLIGGTQIGGPGSPWDLVWFVLGAVRDSAENPQLVGVSLVLAALLQLANAARYGKRLYRNLDQRQFALERGVT